jgi:hypothetical protein
LSLELNSYRSQSGYYIVPLSFEIPPAAVEFGQKGDKQRLQLDVLGLVRGEGGDKILSRLGGNFDVDNLIIFFKIYNPTLVPVTGKALVKVTVTLMKDGKQATKPLEYELNDIVTEPVPQLVFAKYIKLAGLAKGKHSAVIETRDVPQKKVVRQEAQFEITQ